MAEKKPEENPSEETVDETEEVIETVEEIDKVEAKVVEPEDKVDLSGWTPITELGKKVKSGMITDIDDILDHGYKVLEPEIVEALLPGLESELLLIGQSKGKFGGGQRRVFKQTQKKTNEGNKPSFVTMAVTGNKDGYVGIGYGKSKETVPAREKAFRNSKLAIFKIRRGSGSWQSSSKEPHSIPFAVEGKVGSCIIKLFPAPKGTGLVIEAECQKILKLAGVQDVWSKTSGHTKTKMNLVKACMNALKKTMEIKVNPKDYETLAIVDGSAKKQKKE